MNVQLLVDPYKELQSRMLLGINLERVYCAVNVNTFFINFTLCRCQIFKDCIPVVEQANSVIHSALDDPDIPLSSKIGRASCRERV